MKKMILENNRNKDIRHTLKTMLLIVAFTATSAAQSAEFFSHGFEDQNLSYRDPVSNGGWTGPNVSSGGEDSVEISSERAHTGNYSLKFLFGGNTNLDDMAFAEMRYTTGQQMKEFYLRYYIYYPSNFTIRNSTKADNNKVGTTWGEEYSDRAKFNCEWLPGSSVGFKIPSSNTYPHDTPVCEGAIARGMPSAQYQRWTMDDSYLGRWVMWEFHYKLDDGSGNGAYDLFIDGKNVISASKLSFYGAPCRPGYMLNGYLMGWSNSGFNEDTVIYIDDVVFSSTYIGSMETDTTTPTSSTKADVDLSGSIDIIDALLTFRNSLGLAMSGTTWKASATGDTNCDGISNSVDVRLILRDSLDLNMNGTGWCVTSD